MKLGDLHAVECDPVRGGCHVKKLGDVLELNHAAFVDGKDRRVVVAAIQPTLEEALVSERDLKQARKENLKGESGGEDELGR